MRFFRAQESPDQCSSPPSPTPILIPEEPEHPAGISHRLKSQEVLDEGIDLSRDR